MTARSGERGLIDFIQNTVDGVMFGSSYALLAIGFTIVFGVMRRLNLAFGASIMLGAYIGTWLHVHYQVHVLVVALTTVAGTVLVGIYVERLCFHAVRRDAALASMVSSFVIWMQLEEAAIHLLPERTYAFPGLFAAGSYEAGPFLFRTEQTAMLVLAAVMVGALHLLLHRTRFGLALRAMSENPQAAAYMGIHGAWTVLCAFALMSLVGGVAGYAILATDQQITPFFGLWATFKGLIAMMLGGMGSLPGAILGGLLLGVVEAHALWYLGADYRDLSAFLLLFAMLVSRPGGLLGQRILSREELAFRRV